jgi:DNA-directed RNA polymerase specialized sigma24 family protein
VLLSAQSQAPGFQTVIGKFYRMYRYPLYAYARRRGHAPEEAQDLTQGFFLHLLEHAEIYELCEALWLLKDGSCREYGLRGRS